MSATAKDISAAGAELRLAAIAFSKAADASGAPHSVPATLECIEDALRVVSASIDVLAYDAVPPSAGRNHAGANSRMRDRAAIEPRLSWEQQAHLESAIHDLAQDLSRCARSCAETRSIVLPLIARTTAT